MKKNSFYLAYSLILTLITSCTVWSQDKIKVGNGTSMTITQQEGSKEVTTIVIKNNGISLEIKFAGDIKFDETETSVLSISPKGFLKYEKNNQKILVENNEKGELAYEFYLKGKQKPFDAEAKKALQEAITEMIAHGVGAQSRAERIFKKAGVEGLLNELPKFKNDYVKSLYLEYALDQKSISQENMTTIAQNVGKVLGSDFEKAKLLKKFAAQYMQNPATAQAYLEAVGTIDSDFEKANALKHILQHNLSDDAFKQAIQVAQKIDSDFEKANVLKSAFKNNDFPKERLSVAMQCIASIDSDFEKANVLKNILKTNELSENQLNEVLSITKGINSDFEKANVLKFLMNKSVLGASVFEKLLDVIASIDSDFEKANVLKEMTENTLQKEEQWIMFLETAAKIDSDFEKANVLLKIAPKISKSEKAKIAYTKAAKTIKSDWEFGRVSRALE